MSKLSILHLLLETTEQTLAIEEQWMESSGDMLPEGGTDELP